MNDAGAFPFAFSHRPDFAEPWELGAVVVTAFLLTITAHERWFGVLFISMSIPLIIGVYSVDGLSFAFALALTFLAFSLAVRIERALCLTEGEFAKPFCTSL